MRLFRCIMVLALFCCAPGWADTPQGPATYDQLVDKEAAFSLTNAPPAGALPAQETTAPVAVSADGTARHDDTTATRAFVFLLYLLKVIVFVVVPGLAISAIFTKEGRARFNKGEWPETFLVVILAAVVLILTASANERINTRSTGASNKKPRRGGTFDGGGASGNW